MEDRPETSLRPARKQSSASKPRKRDSTSSRHGDTVGYKDFAKPVALNMQAMQQIEPNTRTLYQDMPQTTKVHTSKQAELTKLGLMNSGSKMNIAFNKKAE